MAQRMELVPSELSLLASQSEAVAAARESKEEFRIRAMRADFMEGRQKRFEGQVRREEQEQGERKRQRPEERREGQKQRGQVKAVPSLSEKEVSDELWRLMQEHGEKDAKESDARGDYEQVMEERLLAKSDVDDLTNEVSRTAGECQLHLANQNPIR